MEMKSKERTIDHVIPKCKEGTSNRMWNLVISCRTCNSEKGDSDPSMTQVAVIMRRKFWAESYVVLGQAIGRARKAGEHREALILLGLQKAMWIAMKE